MALTSDNNIASAPAANLRDNTPQFVDVLQRPLDVDAAQSELASLVRRLINARQVHWYSEALLASSDEANENVADHDTELWAVARGVLGHSNPIVESSPSLPDAKNIGIPLPGSGVLACRLIASRSALPSLIAWLQVAAGYFVLAEGKQAPTVQADKRSASEIYAVLLQALFSGTTADEGLTGWCQRLRQLTQSHAVLLCVERPGRSTQRWILSSEEPVAESNGETERLARVFADECRRATSDVDDSLHNHATLPMRSAETLARHLGADDVQGIPLRDHQRHYFATAIIIGQTPGDEFRKHRQQLIQTTAPALALRAHERKLGRSISGVRWLKRCLIGLTIAVLVVALIGIPVPLHLRGTHTLKPTARRFVVAPFDGVLRSIEVRSGDEVLEGDVLGQFDDRSLKIQLSELQVDRLRIEKQLEIELSERNVADAQLAQLRLREIDASMELLQERIQRAVLKSPIDGIILSNDLDDVQGASIGMGRELFEVAPIKKLRAEVGIPAELSNRLEVGQPVKLWIEGTPGMTPGVVEKIAPATEMRDGRNVVRCEISVDNSDLLLRPGMVGQASIHAGSQPLGQQIFGKLWNRVRVYLPFGLIGSPQ